LRRFLVVTIVLAGVRLLPAAETPNHLIVNADLGKQKISKHLYGHFAEHLGRCIYDGIWVGEDSPIPNTRGMRNDILAALRTIQIPNLRWPGGCFADTYHWKDGIGPRDKRPSIVNVHWGGVTENNAFGTHEFLDLCEQIGAEPLICGNVGSGSVQELAQWVEYVNFDGKSPMADLRRANGREKPWKVTYWGIGNESWGCGGSMKAEHYAEEYRQFATYVRDYGDTKVYKIASGPNSDDFEWTDVLMKETASRGWRPLVQGLDLHYYTHVFRQAPSRGGMMMIDRSSMKLSRSATQFGKDEWFVTLQQALRIEDLINKHSAIMDHYDPDKHTGLIVGEWGTWYEVEPGTNPGFVYQQNSLRDALVAGLTLNIFNQHADRLQMANIAQTINVLQAMILTQGEKMILTPTYHVFEMYKVHQDATLLPADLQCEQYVSGEDKLPMLNASASRDAAGRIHITLCNLDPEKSASLSCELRGVQAKKISGRVLTAPAINSCNTFDAPEVVHPVALQGLQLKGNLVSMTLPARSVVAVEIE